MKGSSLVGGLVVVVERAIVPGVLDRELLGLSGLDGAENGGLVGSRGEVHRDTRPFPPADHVGRVGDVDVVVGGAVGGHGDVVGGVTVVRGVEPHGVLLLNEVGGVAPVLGSDGLDQGIEHVSLPPIRVANSNCKIIGVKYPFGRDSKNKNAGNIHWNYTFQ